MDNLVQFWILQFTSCLTLDKLHNLSVLQVFHPSKEDKNRLYLVTVKHLGKYLTRRKFYFGVCVCLDAIPSVFKGLQFAPAMRLMEQLTCSCAFQRMDSCLHIDCVHRYSANPSLLCLTNSEPVCVAPEH